MLVNGKEILEQDLKGAMETQAAINASKYMETSAQTELDPKKIMKSFDDSTSGFNQSDFNIFFDDQEYGDTERTIDRVGRYDTYSEMDTMEFIHRGLELIADDSSQPNDEGDVFSIYSDDEKIKDTISNLFTEKLDFNNELWSILYETIKFGDNFYEVIVDDYKKPKEIKRIRYLDPRKVERIEINGKLSHFVYKTQKKSEDKKITLEQQEFKLFPWQIIHFKIENKETSPYGGSLLKSGVRTFRRLVMLEDIMLVYRISRAPERRVFYIDVGNLNPVEAKRFLSKMKDSYRSQSFIDENGNINKRANVMSITSDIFVPVREGSQGTRIDTLAGGQSMGAAGEDPLLSYFKDKILKTMNIPPAYMGEQSDRSRSLCLHPDTKIKLTDGRSISIKEVSEEFSNGIKNYVYSIDKNNEWVIKPISWAGKTRKNAELVEVVLDNGESVKSTPDHKFMLRDGSYCEAKNLKLGTSLMPIYTKISSKDNKDKIDGYEMLLSNNTGKYEYTHRISVKDILTEEFNKDIKSSERKTTVHHCDFNKENNNPDNLICMTSKSHWELHQRLGKNLRDERVIAKRNESIKKFYNDNIEYAREKMDYARNSEKMKNWIHSEEHRKLKRKQIYRQREEGSIKFTEEIRQKISGKNNYQYRPELELSNMRKIALENNFNKAKQLTDFMNCGYTNFFKRIKEAGYNGYKDFLNQPTNHKVKEVKIISERIDTYDITIDDKTPNFALACGIVVHNSQLDTKFGRFIERVQAQVVKGLNKLAALELFFAGFKKEDLINFRIELTPPSNVKEITEIDIFNQRMALIGTIQGLNLFPKNWILKKILKLSDKEIADIDLQKRLEGAQSAEGAEAGGMTGDMTGIDMGATSDMGGEVPPEGAPTEAPPEAPATEGEVNAGTIINALGKEFLLENKDDFFRLLKLLEEERKPDVLLPIFESLSKLFVSDITPNKKKNRNNVKAQMSINELNGIDFTDRKIKLYEEKIVKKNVKGLIQEVKEYTEKEVKCYSKLLTESSK